MAGSQGLTGCHLMAQVSLGMKRSLAIPGSPVDHMGANLVRAKSSRGRGCLALMRRGSKCHLEKGSAGTE